MRRYVSAAIAFCLIVSVSGESLAEGHASGKGLSPSKGRVASKPVSSDGSTVCRDLQRSVQDVMGAAVSRSDALRSVQAVLRGARAATSKQCQGCILREVARGVPPGDQTPCGTHDICVEGDPLDSLSDACVADVCAVRASCCRKRWDAGCVDLAVGLCAVDCAGCPHDECSEGRALPQSCGDCEAFVCKSDPFCCDTSWDSQCVENALASCTLSCATISGTTATTTTTTSTAPQCRSAADCADGDACTTKTCVAGACTSAPLACDDGNACTADTCDAVSGCVFSSINCDDTNPCTTDSCSNSSGCTHTAVAGCVPCTDASQCVDAKVCTDDVCTAAGTCGHLANLASCDDGNLCTIGDHCRNGSCIGGPIMNCNDNNVCTVDACSAGACNHFTITCSDGNACTTDSCDVVTGCAHQAVNCDDLNPCTTDTCDIVQGCRHASIAGCTP